MQLYKDTRGFLSIIGLLFALAIICYLFYIVINTYFNIPALDKKADEASSGQGILAPAPQQQAPSANYRPVMNHARDTIKDINTRILERGSN